MPAEPTIQPMKPVALQPLQPIKIAKAAPIGFKATSISLGAKKAPILKTVAMFDADESFETEHMPKKKIPKLDFSQPAYANGKSSAKEEDVDTLDAFMDNVVEEVKTLQENMAVDSNGQSESKLDYYDLEMQEEDKGVDEFDIGNLDDASAILEAAAKKSGAKKKDLLSVDHSTIEYMPFRKDFWTEPVELADMSPEELDLKRAELENVKIRGVNCPKPVDTWAQLGLPHPVYDVIKRVLKYEKPSSIQAQAIPAIMSGRDVIGVAKTGSGKTIAFLLPMFRHIKDQPPLQPGDGPIALIMTPTRELAVQIYKECKHFTKTLGLRAVCAYGGAPIKDQIADLKKGAEIVICTPGRIIDLLSANNGRVSNLRRVTYLVLDEADRMFDLGFEPQVMKIVTNVRPDRQTVLFSATFPKQMEALARKILKKPLEITVGGKSVVCSDVTQYVEVRDDESRFMRLLEIMGDAMQEDPDCKVLIFVDRHESADHMLKDMLRRGYPCQSLHGGKDQADRDSTISDFKDGTTNILIATSVAARGLDVKQLKIVFNYDCPNHMEDYVHRVGRTGMSSLTVCWTTYPTFIGRAGNKGISYTFISPAQERYSVDIVKALKMSGAEIPAELVAMANGFISKVKAGLEKMHGSGFGGKGLERLEQERDIMKKIQKKSHGAELDEVSDDEEETIDAASKEALEAQFESSFVEAESDNAANGGPPVQKKLEPSGIAKAREIAAGLSQMGKATTTTSGAIVAYEIEINDFPQRARWRATAKETIAMVTEITGAAITTRGSYIPPGRSAKLGERKLHLHIEGPTRDIIDRAKHEIKQVLFETTVQSMEADPYAGRYTVL